MGSSTAPLFLGKQETDVGPDPPPRADGGVAIPYFGTHRDLDEVTEDREDLGYGRVDRAADSIRDPVSGELRVETPGKAPFIGPG